MIGRVVNWFVQREMQRMIRAEQRRGEAARQTLSEIHESFGDGAAASLLREPAELVRAKAAGLSWNRRPFFWEGYGFGLAGRHAMGLRRRNPEASRATSEFNGMHFTGYGFWNGMARGFRGPRISYEQVRPGLDRGYFDKYSPMIAGGEGFALVAQAQRLDHRVLKRLRPTSSRSRTLASYHGFGRALWFLCIDDQPRLENIVASLPELADELVEGLGYAITFTFANDLEQVQQLLLQLPEHYRSRLLRGAGFALESFVEENPSAEVHLTPQDPDLRDAWKKIRQVSQEIGFGPEWYSRGVMLVRELLP